MAITVEELHDSRQTTRGDGASKVIRALIKGTADEEAAGDAFELHTPETVETHDLPEDLVRLSCDLTPVFVDIEDPGRSVWRGTMHYGLTRLQQETGAAEESFRTGGGTQHITQSRETVGVYGENAPDFRGAIGVTADGIEGVDVRVPFYQWTETKYLPAAYVTQSYKVSLARMTGSMNLQLFRGFAPGEVLFLGADGHYRQGRRDWRIAFSFAARPNRYDVTIGTITGIEKRGWDYLWIRYEETEDTGAGAMVQRPVAVYVERVYPWGDFLRLGIGL